MITTNNEMTKEQVWEIINAQYLIKEQHFYGKAVKILNSVRRAGFDVKIDMQAHKLVWYGGLINA